VDSRRDPIFFFPIRGRRGRFFFFVFSRIRPLGRCWESRLRYRFRAGMANVAGNAAHYMLGMNEIIRAPMPSPGRLGARWKKQWGTTFRAKVFVFVVMK